MRKNFCRFLFVNYLWNMMNRRITAATLPISSSDSSPALKSLLLSKSCRSIYARTFYDHHLFEFQRVIRSNQSLELIYYNVSDSWSCAVRLLAQPQRDLQVKLQSFACYWNVGNHPDPHPVCYTGVSRVSTLLPLQNLNFWSFCSGPNIAKDFWISGQSKQRKNSHTFALILGSLFLDSIFPYAFRQEYSL